MFGRPDEGRACRRRQIQADDDLVLHCSFRGALISEFSWHANDRAVGEAEAVVANGAGQQPAESNVLTGSDNQELRVMGLPYEQRARLTCGELKEPIGTR
jgi:hypothetical protein